MINKTIKTFCRVSIANSYGQGGILKLSLICPHKVNLITTWEDSSLIDLPSPSSSYSIPNESSDKHFTIQQQSYQDTQTINAYLPEYYGLDLSLKGDLNYLQPTIDSKLYGDVSIQSSGNITLNKVKAQFCRLTNNDCGSIRFEKYLESERLDIVLANGSLNIKRLGVTSKGTIQVEKGKTVLGAIYGLQEVKAQEVLYQLDKHTMIQEYMGKTSEVDIIQDSSLIQISILQAYAYLQLSSGTINIEDTNVQSLMINQKEGSLTLHLGQLGDSCYLFLSEHVNLSLSMEQQLFDSLSIYDLDQQTFIKGNTHSQVLYLHGLSAFQPSSIYIRQSMTFMEKLMANKRQREQREKLYND